MNKRHTLQRLAACALLAGAGSFLGACSESKPSFSSVDVTGADYAKGFELEADALGAEIAWRAG